MCRGGEEQSEHYLAAAGLCTRWLRLAGCWDTSTRIRACRNCKAFHPLLEPLGGAALVSGVWQEEQQIQSKCNAFQSSSPLEIQEPIACKGSCLVETRGTWAPFSPAYSLAASAGATHKRVANTDSCPLFQQECMLILTQGETDPSPALSCYQDQPDGERQNLGQLERALRGRGRVYFLCCVF